MLEEKQKRKQRVKGAMKSETDTQLVLIDFLSERAISALSSASWLPWQHWKMPDLSKALAIPCVAASLDKTFLWVEKKIHMKRN